MIHFEEPRERENEWEPYTKIRDIGGKPISEKLGGRSAFSNSYRNSVVKIARKKKYISVSISLYRHSAKVGHY
jgi:hypothetical protein